MLFCCRLDCLVGPSIPLVNPFQSQWSLYWTTIQNINYFTLRRDHQKISYEHRAYESVDDKSLSQAISPKKLWKTEFVTERVKKMKMCKLHYPFRSQWSLYWTTIQNFDFTLWRDHQKDSYLWKFSIYESVRVKNLFYAK